MHYQHTAQTPWHPADTTRELLEHKTIGKTVTGVWLSDYEDEIEGQYICFEFGDGSLTMLSFSNGSSFWLDDDTTARGIVGKRS